MTVTNTTQRERERDRDRDRQRERDRDRERETERHRQRDRDRQRQRDCYAWRTTKLEYILSHLPRQGTKPLLSESETPLYADPLENGSIYDCSPDVSNVSRAQFARLFIQIHPATGSLCKQNMQQTLTPSVANSLT